ncbi:MAG: cation:dicarboxylase symporter family transporter [Synergistaceae bacterium]|jgi:L-cystine uptake protein TcyP (sodium:dicarboxylate symporter family)|nr:cation:dicarboxylase symporter family transporter [Synergistaceae bacterium]
MFWLNVGLLAVVLFVLWRMNASGKSFSVRVLSGLALGILVGLALKYFPADDAGAMQSAMEWYSLVGNGYVALLRMISFPLIMISILSAIVNLETTKALAKKGAAIIVVLIATTAISAAIGIFVAKGFGLRSDAIKIGDAEQKRMEYMEGRAQTNLSLPAQLMKVIPSNPFAAMTGAGDNATLSVVFFSSLLAIAVLILRREEPELAEKFKAGTKVFYGAVLELTYMILELTPYGVCAIMARTLASTNYAALFTLAKFAGASYVALGLVLVMHLLLLLAFGFNPFIFLKKSWPTLSFAFLSRTSAGTLPMTIKTLNDGFGLDKGLSGFAASLGTSMGQNGCAGIYPAMLVMMIAPTLGIDISNPAFLVQVILTVAISSFGVAGVGGGATFAAIMVLSALGLPVGLAGVLISVEPIIDMGRTAINVSDSMVAGLISGKIFSSVDKAVYDSPSV